MVRDTGRVGGAADDPAMLAHQVIEVMEQGVIAWSRDGRCLLLNARVWSMLEIDDAFLSRTTTRADFRARTLARGDITQDNLDQIERMTALAQPYAYDRNLPSGRVVLTTGRPMRDGGTVVTLTDVTDARRAQADLARAKVAAEDAERRTLDILAQERIRQNEARRLAELNEWLQSCKSLDELYMVVERFMPLLLPGAKGELYIYSNSRDALDGQVKWNTARLHPTIAADSCWALRRGRSYEHREGGLCLCCNHVTAHGHTSPLHEYICVPIVAHGDTVGLLHIRFDPAPDHGIDALGAFAMRCGEQISMAIADAKLRDELRDQSIRDPLTGLYNRRYFLEALRRQVSVSGRCGTDFGLVSLDVDHFKTFNDNHGHDAGDAVLHAIGTWLHDNLTGDEIICRYGGEEFVVLAPDSTAERVQALAEHVRDGIAGLRVTYLRETLPRVTVSCGVASFPENGLAPGPLLREADAALYNAKGAGRNTVRTAAPRARPQ